MRVLSLNSSFRSNIRLIEASKIVHEGKGTGGGKKHPSMSLRFCQGTRLVIERV